MDIYRYSFLPRTIPQWNNLQIVNIETLTLTIFKQQLQTVLTFTLLKPAYLSGPGGKHYSIVVNLDGTLEYFSHGHLPYAIPAILVKLIIM